MVMGGGVMGRVMDWDLPVAYNSPNSTDVDEAPTVLPALPEGDAPDGVTVAGAATSETATCC